jgi:hypothetical protein
MQLALGFGLKQMQLVLEWSTVDRNSSTLIGSSSTSIWICLYKSYLGSTRQIIIMQLLGYTGVLGVPPISVWLLRGHEVHFLSKVHKKGWQRVVRKVHYKVTESYRR